MENALYSTCKRNHVGLYTSPKIFPKNWSLQQKRHQYEKKLLPFSGFETESNGCWTRGDCPTGNTGGWKMPPPLWNAMLSDTKPFSPRDRNKRQYSSNRAGLYRTNWPKIGYTRKWPFHTAWKRRCVSRRNAITRGILGWGSVCLIGKTWVTQWYLQGRIICQWQYTTCYFWYNQFWWWKKNQHHGRL